MLARPPGVSSPAQDRQWSVTGQQPQVASADPDWSDSTAATTQMPTARPSMPPGRPRGSPHAANEAPTLVNTPRVQARPHRRLRHPRGPVTAEHAPLTGDAPWEWDGVDVDRRRPPVRFRLVVLPAVAAVAAAVLAVMRPLVEISGTLNPALDGFWKVNDFGTNNTVAAILAMVATVPRGRAVVRRVPLGSRVWPAAAVWRSPVGPGC